MGYIEEIAFPEVSRRGKIAENRKSIEKILEHVNHPSRSIAGTSMMPHLLFDPIEKTRITEKLNDILNKSRAEPYALYPSLKPGTNASSINYGREPIHTCIKTYLGREIKRMLINMPI
jgi:hypothetical protein